MSVVPAAKKRKVLWPMPAWVKESNRNKELYYLARDVIEKLPDTSVDKSILNSKEKTANLINHDYENITNEVKQDKNAKQLNNYKDSKDRKVIIIDNLTDMKNKIQAIQQSLNDKEITVDRLIMSFNELHTSAQLCLPKAKGHRKQFQKKSREREYKIKDIHGDLVTAINHIQDEILTKKNIITKV
jgi:hypothetical protein